MLEGRLLAWRLPDYLYEALAQSRPGRQVGSLTQIGPEKGQNGRSDTGTDDSSGAPRDPARDDPSAFANPAPGHAAGEDGAGVRVAPRLGFSGDPSGGRQ